MDVIEAIHSRRSVREYTENDIAGDTIARIIDAARWAPSGLNNQPWKFVIIKDRDTRNELAQFTHYGRIINDAPLVISVFLDKDIMYDRTKDVLAIGACIQNMLLAAHGMGLGAVWLGEILKNKEKVNAILDVPDSLELMALVALGYPAGDERISERAGLDKIIIKEFV